MALIGTTLPGETALTDQDLEGLRAPMITTRPQLSVVEAANIVSGKEWALVSRQSYVPNMLTVDYLCELHRRMFGDVWTWAGEIRPVELQNPFAASVPDIRPQLMLLYKDSTEFWLHDESLSADEFAVRVHHRVVKTHPFRNGNGRHSRLLADLLLHVHFKRKPLTWGGDAQLGNADPHRQAYLDALRAADKGNYAPLMKLCRAIK